MTRDKWDVYFEQREKQQQERIAELEALRDTDQELITALIDEARKLRERIAELEAELAESRKEWQRWKATASSKQQNLDYAELEAERDELEAEVERLRAELEAAANSVDAIASTDMGVSMALGYIVERIGITLGWERDKTSVVRPYAIAKVYR